MTDLGGRMGHEGPVQTECEHKSWTLGSSNIRTADSREYTSFRHPQDDLVAPHSRQGRRVPTIV